MIWNLGFISIDNFYRLPHLPEPRETIAANGFEQGLGEGRGQVRCFGTGDGIWALAGVNGSLTRLDRGLSMLDAIELAMKAAALLVARHRTTDVILDHDFS